MHIEGRVAFFADAEPSPPDRCEIAYLTGPPGSIRNSAERALEAGARWIICHTDRVPAHDLLTLEPHPEWIGPQGAWIDPKGVTVAQKSYPAGCGVLLSTFEGIMHEILDLRAKAGLGIAYALSSRKVAPLLALAHTHVDKEPLLWIGQPQELPEELPGQSRILLIGESLTEARSLLADRKIGGWQRAGHQIVHSLQEAAWSL